MAVARFGWKKMDSQTSTYLILPAVNMTNMTPPIDVNSAVLFGTLVFESLQDHGISRQIITSRVSLCSCVLFAKMAALRTGAPVVSNSKSLTQRGCCQKEKVSKT